MPILMTKIVGGEEVEDGEDGKHAGPCNRSLVSPASEAGGAVGRQHATAEGGRLTVGSVEDGKDGKDVGLRSAVE